MTLCGQIVNLVGLGLLNNAQDIGAVGEVAIVQVKVRTLGVRVVKHVVYARGIKRAAAALDAVNNVSLFKQEMY